MSKGPTPFDQGLFLMHLHKGKEYFDQDQLQKAREELEAAYHLRPQDEKILNMLGMTYYKLEMLPEAEDMYVTLAANNPDIYALQSNLGLIQLKLNRLQQARDSLNRALELQPTNSKAHFYMGLLYEKQELWEDALYHFEQAHAEKMVAKMQGKLDEQKESDSLLPFEVIEILQPEVISEREKDLASFVQEEMQAPTEEPFEEHTGRMRTPDLAEAMLQMHQEEGPFEMPYEPPQEETQTTLDIEPPQEQTEREIETPAAEEPAEIETPAAIAGPIQEEVEEIKPWEKTHPTIFPEQFGIEPETVVQSETTFLISPPVDDPFLLSDDIAADISTFLAQSRVEENSEEDVFYKEPILPEFAVVTTTEIIEQEMPVDEEPEHYRIPTPEEVENEITGTAEEASVTETPVGSQAKLIAEAVEELMSQPPEEAVEELSEVAESEEEDMKVNFAVNDSEEEQIQEGFLEPSPLTPEIEEHKLEKTQDMAYTVEPMETAWNLQSPELDPEHTPAHEEGVQQAQEAQETQAVEEPAIPEVQEPEIQDVREQEIPEVQEPEIQDVREQEIPEVQEPEIQNVREQKIPEVQEPEIQDVREQEIPEVQEPEIQDVREQEVLEVQEPEIQDVREQEIPEVQESEIQDVREQEIPEVQEPEIPEIQETHDTEENYEHEAAEAHDVAPEVQEEAPEIQEAAPDVQVLAPEVSIEVQEVESEVQEMPGEVVEEDAAVEVSEPELELEAESFPQPGRPEERLVTQEMPYPANLDQFSRDRLYLQPFAGADRFLLIDPHLLEVIISEKLICKIGTISSYTGNLEFTPWDMEQREQIPLVIINGSGIIFLADRRKEILLISLNNEVIFVEANHLLVAQSSLRVEPQILGPSKSGGSFSVVRISGRGTLALTCLTKPLTVSVREELPANIPAQAIIAWSGKLLSQVLDDDDLKKILMSGDADQMFLRFLGSGDVVVEQGGLWGDRRTTRK